MHNRSLALSGLLLTLLVSSAMAPHQASAQEVSDRLLSSSPFAPCPGSGNCAHAAYAFDIVPSELAEKTMQALRGNKHLDSVQQGTVDYHRIDAVFNAWNFKDDVSIAIEVHEEGSVLFVKSESRVGKYDLGVNKRRIKRLIKAIRAL